MERHKRILFPAVFLISLILMLALLLFQDRLARFDASLYATMTAIR